MRFSWLKLRFSLRSLFLATFVAALLLQGRLSALQHQRDQRREVFVTDLREQVVAAERIEPQFGCRMLAFVERRITKSPDAALLSSREQQQLLQLVQSAYARLPNALPPSAATPATDEWAWANTETCPW